MPPSPSPEVRPAEPIAKAMPAPRVLPPAARVTPPAAPASGVSAAPSNYPGSAAQGGPKKETARISILPDRAAPAAPAKMAKTQPLITAPEAKAPAAPVKIAPPAAGVPIVPPGVELTGIDAIPRPLVWAVFGISAVTFLIQIWNYFST